MHIARAPSSLCVTDPSYKATARTMQEEEEVVVEVHLGVVEFRRH